MMGGGAAPGSTGGGGGSSGGAAACSLGALNTICMLYVLVSGSLVTAAAVMHDQLLLQLKVSLAAHVQGY